MRRAPDTLILLLLCPDAPGLVAQVSRFLWRRGANILHADQHEDEGLFFMRVEWERAGFSLDEKGFSQAFSPIARKFSMRWRLYAMREPMRLAVFVSKALHCLADLLFEERTGSLPGEIACVISNHEDVLPLCDFHQKPFFHLPVSPETKPQAEKEAQDLLREFGVKLTVLARYMQVLSPEFVHRWPMGIINIHHSFLPAFSGAKPYAQAFRHGVKLIGATSHFVTEELDAGPIIEQDVIRVSHRDRLEDFIQKGQDLERVVLSRAVRWTCAHRVLAYANKTVVFD